MKVISITILIIVAVGVFWFVTKGSPDAPDIEVDHETTFSHFGLRTNTEKANIPLEEVLSGGPGKDGIPAINEPKFVSIEDADVGDGVLGVLVTSNEKKRYYPYNILVWHEIVNDSIDDTHFAVTFCPLCGSAIVFNREVDEEILTFGVSGLLWESNLLMYDTKTESLWSQAKNEAVIGEYAGTKLSLIDMRLLEFSKLKRFHPDARVLSRDTGFVRMYNVEPYSGYGLTDETYFPVSVSDTRFPPKQIMYVVPFEGKSYAFPEADLDDSSEFATDMAVLRAKRLQDGLEVTRDEEVLPGYYEMWFSWATQHQDNGVVWPIE